MPHDNENEKQVSMVHVMELDDERLLIDFQHAKHRPSGTSTSGQGVTVAQFTIRRETAREMFSGLVPFFME